MNAKKTITVAVCSTLFCSAQLFGQGITTLICQDYQTNKVTITSSQTAKLMSYYDNTVAGSGPTLSQINIQSGPNTVTIQAPALIGRSTVLTPLMIAGPATISLATVNLGSQAMITLDIEPGPYPPGKTATVGSNSGNVQVTMEMSTDLVNWTPAVNGQVYTNCPDARFFRIKLVTNASP